MRMGEVGLFKEEDRVELIDGELYRMYPIGVGHSGHVIRLTQVFSSALGTRVQNPVQIRPRGQPLPDGMLLRPRPDFCTTAHPVAVDVFLMIEEADSSLVHDRDTKWPMYAAAGIMDYWILDLTSTQLLVMRQPVDGSYRSVQTLTREETVQPLAFPDLTLTVSEILG